MTFSSIISDIHKKCSLNREFDTKLDESSCYRESMGTEEVDYQENQINTTIKPGRGGVARGEFA